jgi:hypothetical protein
MSIELVQSQGTVCAGSFLMAAAMRMASTAICSTKAAMMLTSRSENGVG